MRKSLAKIIILVVSFITLSLALSACSAGNLPIPGTTTEPETPTVEETPSIPEGGTLEAITAIPTTSATTTVATTIGIVEPTIAIHTPTSTTVASQTTTQNKPTTPKPVTTSAPKPTAARTTAAATTAKPAPVSGPLSEVFAGKSGKKQVAITFDAGSSADAYLLIESALKKYNVKITFFLTGVWAQQNPQYVQQMAKDGMEVGNHTWNHPDLTKLNAEDIKTEINRTDELLTKLIGHTTKPLFRFPYGARDANSVATVNGLGYRSIYWTLDSQDSVGQPKSVDYLVNRITGKTNAELDGSIILMHIGTRTSGEALPIIIEKLQARGFKIVPVSEIIR